MTNLVADDQAEATLSSLGVEGAVEILGRDDCLALLGTATLGRLCITRGALPVVVPMNFRLVGDRIVFRVANGTRLDGAVEGAVVAFEAGEARPGEDEGWSVSVTGMARSVSKPGEIAILEQAGIARWTEWGPDHFVVLPTALISGWRLTVHHEPRTTEAATFRPCALHGRDHDCTLSETWIG